MSTLETPAPSAHTRSTLRRMAATPTGDVGLLLLRVTLAISFVGHGLQKFGFLGGTGIDGFAAGTLAGYGFRFPVAMAYMTGATEVVGGVGVALGLLTPLAATGLMAVMINSMLLKFGNGFFFTNPGGYEVDLVLGGLAAGLVLAGPGRIALDAVGPRFLRSTALRWAALVLGVAAALAVLVLLR